MGEENHIVSRTDARAQASQLLSQYMRSHKGVWTTELIAGDMMSNPFFNAATDAGAHLQAHGMSKGSPVSVLHQLFGLFDNGIDTDTTEGRRGHLCTAPLTAHPGEGLFVFTGSGTAYRDGPFILVAHKDMPGAMKDVRDIAGVLVNQSLAEEVPDLMRFLPLALPDTVMVRAYSDVSDVIEHAKTTPLGKASIKPFTPSQDTHECKTEIVNVEPTRPTPSRSDAVELPPPPAIINLTL